MPTGHLAAKAKKDLLGNVVDSELYVRGNHKWVLSWEMK